MIFTHTVEEERIGIFLVLTNVSQNECPACSCRVKMISPPAFFRGDLLE